MQQTKTPARQKSKKPKQRDSKGHNSDHAEGFGANGGESKGNAANLGGDQLFSNRSDPKSKLLGGFQIQIIDTNNNI